MNILSPLKTMSAALAFVVCTDAALAATVTTTDCVVGSVSGATSCEGVFSGNNSNSDLNGLFGNADWGTEYKIDASSGSVFFDGATLTVSDSDKSWSLDTIGGYASLMFVLKGGPTYSAFLMDVSVLSGTWDNLSMLKGNGRAGAGLSHWSVYTQGAALLSAVPLPSSILMLLSAFGAAVFMRRRKAA
ncbi:VPLPA-CTERM sorting domain-containing protein [Puniceibacterium sediminis]|uniref:VPLPA-CTERM protein sorting domain-containing protein n=1 Tax=Puniceibacterium sediminis TaxID=1608407 RepID=A0A238XEF7_9RHOB|nr:VPLPA-CTERM sorting domain-containing protein [Puniceibacterium sediminis]SNR57405.1 VPLPA-CTERM protein sorting domain-containing protein [Puniceibacterium sediminis]